MATLKPPTLTPYLDWLLLPQNGIPPAIPSRLVLNRTLVRDLNLSSDWFYGRSFPLWSAGKTRGLCRKTREKDGVPQLLIGSIPYPEGGSRNLELMGCSTAESSGKSCFSTKNAVIETVASEFCHSLSIPTARVLSVISDSSINPELEPCMLVTRVIRNPLTQADIIYVAKTKGPNYIHQLLAYLAENLFNIAYEPNDKEAQAQVLMAISNSCLKTAAAWESSGFYYGTLNHESLTVLGETRNFGLSGFIKTLNGNFNGLNGELVKADSFHIQGNRVVALCCEFIDTLYDTLDITRIPGSEVLLKKRYQRFLREAMTEKLGLAKGNESEALTEPLMDLLRVYDVDYYDFFFSLNLGDNHQHLADQFDRSPEFQQWLQQYHAQKASQKYEIAGVDDHRMNPPRPLDTGKVEDILRTMAEGNRNAVENVLESIYHRKQLSPTQWAS